jgi:hypothetical protein
MTLFLLKDFIIILMPSGCNQGYDHGYNQGYDQNIDKYDRHHILDQTAN